MHNQLRQHVLAHRRDDIRARDRQVGKHGRLLRNQRGPVADLGLGIGRRHHLPVGGVVVRAEIHPVALERSIGAELVARVDRPWLRRRAERTDANRVRPEIAGLEHRHVGLFGLVDRAIVLRIADGEHQHVVATLAAEPVLQATHRLLVRVGLGGARRDERIALVARPSEAVEPGDHRPDLRTGRAVDDAEVLALAALRVHADGESRRVAIGHDGADLRLARRIERDRIEQQLLASVDPRVQLGLRLAAPRPLEEFARILEQRRIRLVAIEVARQLVLHPRHRRRVAIEELDRCRVLRARPGGDLGILAVLEPPVTVRQRRAMNDVDDGSRRRFRRKERRCTDRLDRGQQCRGHEVSEDFFRHCMSSVEFV